MKKRLFTVFALTALLALSVSCSTNIGTGYYAKDGNLFVNLEGNATTGYMWVYAIGDETVLKCKTDEYKPYKTPAGFAGSGGIWSAEFKALSPGTTYLSFTYCRSWENGFAKRIILEVNVDSDLKITFTQTE